MFELRFHRNYYWVNLGTLLTYFAFDKHGANGPGCPTKGLGLQTDFSHPRSDFKAGMIKIALFKLF